MIPPAIADLEAAETRAANPYYYILPYVPTRYHATEEEQTYRQIIWDFKNGTHSSKLVEFVAKSLKEIVKSNFGNSNDVYLCIIPASTAEKTKTRFSRFCDAVCKASDLKNGYDIIKNKIDREANHLIEGGGDGDIMKFIEIGDVKGKKIILLDDVTTRGRSYNKVTHALENAGAGKRIGFFIGKTTWKEE